jgi:hypothetical protein
MKRSLAGFAVAVVLLAGAAPAHAIISTDVVLLVGVELDPAAGQKALASEKALARQGLRVLVTPSMVFGNVKPVYRYYVGRAIGTLSLDRSHSANVAQAITLQVPDAAAIAATEKALRQAGFTGPVSLHAVMQQHGGK